MNDPPPDHGAFAERLRSLAPAAPRLDRAAVLAAAVDPPPTPVPDERPPRTPGWKLAAVAGWATAAGLAVAWFHAEPRVRVEERVVVKTAEAPASPSPLGGALSGAPPVERNAPPVGDGEPGTPPSITGDETARLLAWIDSPAGGPLTAAGLRGLPAGWPPPAPRRTSRPATERTAVPPFSAPASVRELSRRWRDGLL